jgi:mRNA interferase RelE/StbE
LTTSSPPARKHKYSLEFHPTALEEWTALDGSVKKKLKKLLEKRLDNPHVPGGTLTADLLGCYKIKLLKEGVRLVYRVQDDALIVMVMAVDRREDGVVYQSALARLGATVKALADAAKKAVTPSNSSNRPARKKK